MKKLFAFLTAICCLSGIVSAIPVSAEDFNEQEFCVVSRNAPADSTRCYLHCYSEIMCIHSASVPKYQTEHIRMNLESVASATGDKTSGYEYGDILIIDGEYGSNDIDPAQYYVSDVKEVRYVGNCKELLESKEFTITKKEEDRQEPYGGLMSILFSFEDETGNEYQYIDYYTWGEPEIDMNSCSVGDTVTFSVYQDTLILPLELHRSVITGDVDGNGRLDILDVIKINKAVLGKEELAEARIADADFNGNGMIDAEDSLTVMKMIVGLV